MCGNDELLAVLAVSYSSLRTGRGVAQDWRAGATSPKMSTIYDRGKSHESLGLPWDRHRGGSDRHIGAEVERELLEAGAVAGGGGGLWMRLPVPVSDA